MATPEAKVRDPVVKWWKSIGGKHYRMSMARGVRTGRPDDLFLHDNGFSCWVEFKALGKKPTKLQLNEIAELAERGHNVFWSDSSFWSKEVLLDALMNNCAPRGNHV